MKQNIETFIGCDCEYEKAEIVLFGAPFDSTTSYRPGARFGSSAMRHESFGLETYSPYQDKDLTDCFVFDSGDLELCFGNTEDALSDIEQHADQIMEEGKMPLLLGGEHLVTLANVRAVYKRFPEMHIIHFDAHTDLREDYLGAKLSHACVIRRCHDMLGDGRIHQFCIRSGEREEFAFAKEHTDLHPFDFEGLEQVVQQLKENNILQSIWTVWIRLYFREQELRRPEESRSCSCYMRSALYPKQRLSERILMNLPRC